jgi:integrase
VYLINGKGLEEDYSALFAICSIRNPGLSVASQEAALNAINVLYAFCEERGIDLTARFKAGTYLTSNECRALGDFARFNFGVEYKKRRAVVQLGKVRRGYVYSMPTVERQTHFKRLTHIANFSSWLAKYLLTHTSRDRADAISQMQDEILQNRLEVGARRDDFDDVLFTLQDNDLLSEIIAPGAPRNPFATEVQLRNLLLVELLRQTGIRHGEALNLQVRDVDHVKREIRIRRRHDDKDDPRLDQPLVKTSGRAIPISVGLTDLIVQYVALRRSVPGAAKNRYLFVTHKSGPTQGQPMTKDAVKAVFNAIKGEESKLSHLTPHKLRHLFNSELARYQHQQGSDPNSKETHRRVRNYIAGRKPTSEVDALYTELETKRQAQEAMLKVQERMATKAPTGGIA